MKKLIIACLLAAGIFSTADAANYHGMGRNAYVYRNYDKAREYFLLDVKDNPNRGDSYYFLGEIEKTLKNYDESLKYFQIAVTKSTTRKYMINAYWNIIILYEEKGDFTNFVKYCREMWYRTGDSSAKRKIESVTNKLLWSDNDLATQRYNEAVELSKKGDKTGAIKLFREAIDIDVSFLAPRFELGMIAYNNGNESEALGYLKPIGERIPFYAEVHLILGKINFQNRNYSAAAGNFSSVLDFGFIDKGTEYSTVLKRGTCYYHMNNFDLAEKDIASYIEHNKNDSEPLILLSAIYIRKRDFDSALKMLSRAESISAGNPVVLFQAGSIYYYKNDSQYVGYFDRLFDLSKKDREAVTQYMKAFRILLDENFKKRKYSRSVEISEVISGVHKDQGVMLIAAVSYYNLQQYDKAINHFGQVTLNNSAKVMLASCYAHTGDRNRSVDILKTIIYDTTSKNEALKDPILKKYIAEIEESERIEKLRKEAELKARAEARAKAEAETKAKAEAAAKAKAEAEAKAKAEAEAKAKAEAEAKAKAEAETKTKGSDINNKTSDNQSGNTGDSGTKTSGSTKLNNGN